ncbi:MAG: excalibur calcium-binding domain-containing protein [Pseudonocardiaceae bacterium]
MTSAETVEATPTPEPADDETTVGDVDVVAPPPAMPTPASRPASPRNDSDDTDSSGGSVYYKNCSAARAAGAAPLYAGEPGYAAHLDRDGDGVACES